MVTVNAFGVVLLNVSLMIELYLRQTVSCFIQRNNIFNILVFGFDTRMAFLAFYRPILLPVTVFAERMKNYHF